MLFTHLLAHILARSRCRSPSRPTGWLLAWLPCGAAQVGEVETADATTLLASSVPGSCSANAGGRAFGAERRLTGAGLAVKGIAATGATKACAICGDCGTRVVAHRFGYPIARCGRCGTVFTDLAPSTHEILELYSDRYFRGGIERRGYCDYGADESVLRASFRRKLRLVNRFAPRKGALLDVGCAYGYFLDVAEKSGWRCFGLEASPFAASEARARGHRVVHGVSLGAFGSGTFDAVTMWDVLEHMPDPVGCLRDVHRVLLPGGLLALCTGRIDSLPARIQGFRSRIYNPPQHLYFFSRQSLGYLLALTGFRLSRVLTETKVVSLRYVLHLVRSLSQDGVPSRLVSHVLRLGVNFAFPIWLPDNMVVLAHRMDAPGPRGTGSGRSPEQW